MAWNGSSQEEVKKAPAYSPSPKFNRGIIAGLVVVLGGAIAAWLMMGDKGEKDLTNERVTRSKISEVKPQIDPASIPDVPETTGNSKEHEREQIEEPGVATPSHAAEAPKKGTATGSTVHRTFKSGLESVLSYVFMTELGDNPPPLPQVMVRDEQELADILNRINEVKEGDSERTADSKRTVDMAKEELKSYMAQGGTVDDFLKYYHRQLRDAFKDRMNAQRQLSQFCDESQGNDAESAISYYRAINKMLDERGIKHVRMPAGFMSKNGIKEEDL